jgi:hypothetical protein
MVLESGNQEGVVIPGETPPNNWFSYIVVGDGDRVRVVGYSGQFNDALGDDVEKILKWIKTINLFIGNPDEMKSRGFNDEAIQKMREELNERVKTRTGFSFDEIEKTRFEIEDRLNGQPNPPKAAKEQGLMTTRDKPAEGLRKGQKPDLQKFRELVLGPSKE